MRSLASSPSISLKFAVGLLALLLLLATLQYHWLGQVSQAEQQRMQMSLGSAVERFADDFNREVTRAFLYFFPEPDRRAATQESEIRFVEQFGRWSNDAPYPELIRDLFIMNVVEGEARELKKLDPSVAAFVEIGWPDAFSSLRLHVTKGPQPRDRKPGPGWRGIVDEKIPAILLPVSPPWIWGERRPNVPVPPEAFLIIQLDLGFLTEALIPELVGRHFSRGDEIDYELVITSSTEPENVIYALRHDDAPMGSGDASVELLSPNLARARRDFLFQGNAPAMSGRPGPARRGGPLFERMASAFRGGGHWVLTVRHRAGSLEAAVDRARWRNLTVSFAILGLLGISVVMIIISTERARELARQKVEFVAGVSHELKTPLSVIRSAGQNLADGTIEESPQVKRYGSLVETEGRRLSDLVDQILHFAGTLSERNPYELEVASLAEIIESALDDCRTVLQEEDVRVEARVPERLPRVRADRSALRRAVWNVLDNAIKFSGDEGRITLHVEEDKGGEIKILIEDNGQGIPKSELAHIFEPFYRGRGAAQVHGSGLGLSLVKQIVEAHGGRVSVESDSRKGSRFTISLPTVKERD